MNTTMVASSPVAARARIDRDLFASTVTTVTATGFLVVLAALHLIKSDLSPTWRMVSEYEIGRYGWLMQGAFLMLAVSTVGACIILRPVTSNRAGRIGRSALLMTAGGLALAGFATADPITSTTAQLTTHGNLHGLGAMLGIPGLAVASIALARSVRNDATYTRPVRHATYFVVAAIAVFIVSMVIMFHGAPATPDVQIGIQNRVLVMSHAAFLLVVANRARHARR